MRSIIARHGPDSLPILDYNKAKSLMTEYVTSALGRSMLLIALRLKEAQTNFLGIAKRHPPPPLALEARQRFPACRR
jgi:hypothetical protein